MNHLSNEEYSIWLSELKRKIRKSQIKAALSVNRELIQLYWELGKTIVEKQSHSKWGSKLIEQLSNDLKSEFPDIGGFSKRNLETVKKWYLFYTDNTENQIAQQLVAQFQSIENECITNIPWGHHILIITKVKIRADALFYVRKTIENNWSRAMLSNQISSRLHERQGRSLNNFSETLPAEQSDLAKELLKDPYQFDFLQLSEKFTERELEKALINHISNFLIELGAGFSFVGKQYKLKIGEKEYSIDLLFYHLTLRCFVVIELKVNEFEPEYAGKLNFYLNVVDDLLKHQSDAPTIGILICKTKNNVEVEYSLKGLKSPIGISEYEFQKELENRISQNLLEEDF